MRSSAAKGRWWQLVNAGVGHYRNIDGVLGSVSWTRRGSGDTDRILWCATIQGRFDQYDEFDTKEQAMTYVEAITALET